MTRKLEFDRTRALEEAMKLFWSHGYGAASLADLLVAMEISRSSFYASFKDKRRLFIECLDLFAWRTLILLEEPAIASAPEESAAVFFQKTLFDVPRKRANSGCMMVNTVVELAEVEPDLCRRAVEKLGLIEARFEQLFGDAIARGRLDTRHSPRALAQYVMTVNQGLRVQSRKHGSRAELRNIVDNSLSLVGLAA